MSRRRRWPRAVAATASAMILLATGAAGVGAVAYRNLDDNIVAKDLSPLMRPTDNENSFEEGRPLNILIMGSDTRVDQDADDKYGNAVDIAGARSDTSIFVHISADRKDAFAVSIPRDTLVNIPSCPQPDGQQSTPKTKMKFNEAFSIGGPLCTVKTVEGITGVTVDHFAVVDFSGFKDVVDALDGVEVCLKKPVDDPLSGLKLPAGYSTVKGEDALAFVRARYNLGDGSDISRIDRQQAFLASAIRKATSLEVLSNPITAYRVLDKVTKSLTTDAEFASLSNVQALALSMSDMSPGDITFFTVPFVYNQDGATVSIDTAQAAPIWEAMKNDTGYPPPPTIPAGQDEPLRAAPETIAVSVANGTAKPGRSQEVGKLLSDAGYRVVSTTGYPESNVGETLIRYPKGQEEAARTLAYALGTDDVQMDPSLTGSTVKIVIGTDFTGVKPVIAEPLPVEPTPGSQPTTPAPDTTPGISGDEVICS